jgi:hypothetical protein
MTEHPKVSVLLDPAEADRFDAYCKSRGFKKSTLVARLIREHMDQEGFAAQPSLFESAQAGGKRS